MPKFLLLFVATLLLMTSAGAARADHDHGGPASGDVSAANDDGVEGYSTYEPQATCHPKPRAGTKVLGRWVVKKFGGAGGATGRSCGGGASEHKDGRAIDWTLNADTKRGRQAARKFLKKVFRIDKAGNQHAKARRMGIMYVIWKDRMYSAWDQFEPEPYLSSSCKKRKKCSKTLRHRDHMHISLSMAGAKGKTSWYERRLPG